MSTTRSASRGIQLVVAISTSIAAVAGAAGAGIAASPEASPSLGAGATTYASSVYPFTIVLPPGWTVTSVAPESTGELFSGPDGAAARLGSPGPVPGQTVADRVAANRAEMIDLGCTSDPAAERPTTLGREPAIEWTFACNDSFSIARNAIHEGAGYRLSITTPSDREAEAPVLMARLAGSFVFVDAVTSPSPSTDLAAIDARLQGTWRTEWAPTALWIASVEAAGLDPDDLEGFRAEMLGSAKRRQTIRFQGDQMVEFVAIDNGQDQLGSQATYRLVDSDTIEAVSPDGVYRTTFDFQLQDDILVIDAIEDTDPLALIPQTAIFETLPFVRVP